jgi:hypothetical protein
MLACITRCRTRVAAQACRLAHSEARNTKPRSYKYNKHVLAMTGVLAASGALWLTSIKMLKPHHFGETEESLDWQVFCHVLNIQHRVLQSQLRSSNGKQYLYLSVRQHFSLPCLVFLV